MPFFHQSRWEQRNKSENGIFHYGLTITQVSYFLLLSPNKIPAGHTRIARCFRQISARQRRFFTDICQREWKWHRKHGYCFSFEIKASCQAQFESNKASCSLLGWSVSLAKMSHTRKESCVVSNCHREFNSDAGVFHPWSAVNIKMEFVLWTFILKRNKHKAHGEVHLHHETQETLVCTPLQAKHSKSEGENDSHNNGKKSGCPRLLNFQFCKWAIRARYPVTNCRVMRGILHRRYWKGAQRQLISCANVTAMRWRTHENDNCHRNRYSRHARILALDKGNLSQYGRVLQAHTPRVWRTD